MMVTRMRTLKMADVRLVKMRSLVFQVVPFQAPSSVSFQGVRLLELSVSSASVSFQDATVDP